MMIWKRSLKLAAVAVLAASLAACGSSSQGSGSKTAEDGSVKLRIMWWGSQDRHEATLKVLEKYTELHPNVTFEPEYSGMDGYLDKLSTQAAAKNAPDIIQLDPGWISDWSARGQLADLSSGIDLSKVGDKVLTAGKYEGKQYAVPLGSVAYGMIYDKAALDKLGAAPPQNGWTWEDFFALARSLKGKLPEGQYFTKDYAGDYFAYSAYQYAKGKGQVVTDEGVFNVDRDTFLEWTRTFAELRSEGLVPPADLNASDKEFDPGMDLMVSGKILFRLAFSNNFGAWDSLKKDAYALVTMPRAEEAGGWLKPSMFFGVSASSAHTEEAKKFIDWFINDPDIAKTLGTTRGLPVNSEVAAGLEANMSDTEKVGMELLRATEKDGQIFSTGAKGWTSFIDKDWPLVRDELSFGQTTPEEAYEKLQSAAKEYEK
ncbi:ABC transporter substrate-binding protein [Paenibacillus terreus]|uniref:ABC transporter substrate-binding protein n=1 Tax=Paenibacillus terreus TaxID=1387834 RepID=A0ABV5BAY6_9BACL